MSPGKYEQKGLDPPNNNSEVRVHREMVFLNDFVVADADTAPLLQLRGGRTADTNYLGKNLHLIAGTDAGN